MNNKPIRLFGLPCWLIAQVIAVVLAPIVQAIIDRISKPDKEDKP